MNPIKENMARLAEGEEAPNSKPDYADKIFVANEELDGKGHHLMILTYDLKQAEQMITEFQNEDNKPRLSEEKRVRKFLARLYKSGFLIAHVGESPRGVISTSTHGPLITTLENDGLVTRSLLTLEETDAEGNTDPRGAL